MAERMCEKDTESVYAFLYKDRAPFASARLCGEGENAGVCGGVSFYETPLGVLVRAELCGLKKQVLRKKRAYNFCVRDERTKECLSKDNRSLCTAMPTAYEKDGCFECVLVTRRISPSDLVGKKVVVYECSRGCPKSISDAVAYGRIES